MVVTLLCSRYSIRRYISHQPLVFCLHHSAIQMTRGYCPGSYALVQIIARAVAWMTGVTTLVILAFIINQWSGKAGAVAAGLVGVSLQVAWWWRHHRYSVIQSQPAHLQLTLHRPLPLVRHRHPQRLVHRRRQARSRLWLQPAIASARPPPRPLLPRDIARRHRHDHLLALHIPGRWLCRPR